MPLTSTESWKGAGGTPAPHLCFRSSPLTTALQKLSNNDTGSRSWDSPDPQCAWLYGHSCTDGIYGPRAQERHHHPIGCYLLYLEWIPEYYSHILMSVAFGAYTSPRCLCQRPSGDTHEW